MENENVTEESLEEEVVTTETEEAEEPQDDTDDFEYDDNGDIVISEEESSETEEEPTDDDGADDSSEETEGKTKTEEAEEENTPPTADKTPADTENRKNEELEDKLSTLEKQTKDALEKLGVKIEPGESVMDTLVKISAEAEGISPDEYRKKLEEKRQSEAGMKLLKQAAFEKMASEDLAALHSEFPETKKYNHIREIPNFKRFGELRDMGVPAAEAYSAANASVIRAEAADIAKRQSLSESKKHLRSNVPKGSKETALTMPKKTLEEWRYLFPKLTDKQIIERYREAMR